MNSTNQLEKKIDELLISPLFHEPEDIPENLLDFQKEFMSKLGLRDRNYNLNPQWNDILNDDFNNIVILAGRQTMKTTYMTMREIHQLLKEGGCETGYVTSGIERMKAYSLQRFRIETMQANQRLSAYLPYGHRASINSIPLLNTSIAYHMIADQSFKNVESRSLSLLLCDESQYLPLSTLPMALASLNMTRGKIVLAGIGSNVGSDWWKKWNESDKRIWKYDDKDWRDKIKFSDQGLPDNESWEFLNGKWIITNPSRTRYSHGYRLSQEDFLQIPLTINDAIDKYHVLPETSLEWHKRYSGISYYTTHCLGDFVVSELRPITPDLVRKSFDFTLPMQDFHRARTMRDKLKNKIRYYGGVDFGSGNKSASDTVITILEQNMEEKTLKLVYCEKRPPEPVMTQARFIAELFSDWSIDSSLLDYGYGLAQVEAIQDGGIDNHGIQFDGLGRSKVQGCISINDVTKPLMEFQQVSDSEGKQLQKVKLDKNRSLQDFVDVLNQYKSDEDSKPVPVYTICAKHDYEVDRLLDGLCSLTRKDVTDDLEGQKDDTRVSARLEYLHPDDFLMSCVYSYEASKKYDPLAHTITPVRRTGSGLKFLRH